MPLGVDRLPAGASALWEAVKKLQRDVSELRASRRAESTAVGSGGITVQDPANPEKLVVAAHDAIGFSAGGPTLYHPPALLFYTGETAEVLPGEMVSYAAPGEFGSIPTVLLTTPDLGNGTAYIKFQAGYPGGEAAAVLLAAGGSSVLMGSGAFYVGLNTGAHMQFDGAGAQFQSEPWTVFPYSGDWSDFGGGFQAVRYRKLVTNVVMFEGIAKRTSAMSEGAVIGTMPAGYIPAADRVFGRRPGAVGTTGVSADIYVRGLSSATPGQIEVRNIQGSPNWLTFEGVQYSLD